jgi:hypothetical protein
MEIVKTVTLCNECGMKWIKPFWEPLWLSRLGAAQEHDKYHAGNTDGKDHQLVKVWREWERERIIKVLNDYFELCQETDDNPEWENGFQAAIAIAKAN